MYFRLKTFSVGTAYCLYYCCRWKDNITIGLKEIRCKIVVWILNVPRLEQLQNHVNMLNDITHMPSCLNMKNVIMLCKFSERLLGGGVGE